MLVLQRKAVLTNRNDSQKEIGMSAEMRPSVGRKRGEKKVGIRRMRGGSV